MHAKVDVARREGIRRAHSATHILHHALQAIVGGHAQQQGSKVDEDWLRFDFTNQQSLSSQQIELIEDIVVDKVRRAEPISWNTVPLAEARKAGAMMLFGEKYPDPVRMVCMGEFSKELCGGTHVDNTGRVESFEIVGEESVSAGTRRVVALTGRKAEQHRQDVKHIVAAAAVALGCPTGDVVQATKDLVDSIRSLKKQLTAGGSPETPAPVQSAGEASDYLTQRAVLRDAARLLNTSPGEMLARIKTMQEEQHKLEQQVAALTASSDVSADSLIEQAKQVAGVCVLVTEVPGATPNLMRQWIDQIRQKSKQPTAVMLITRAGEDKVLLIAGLGRDLVARGLSAGQWISQVAPRVGGGGGGKPDLAQAGGKQPQKIGEALEHAKQVIAAMLAS